MHLWQPCCVCVCVCVCVCKLHDVTGQSTEIQFVRYVPLCCVCNAELHTHPMTQRHSPDKLHLQEHCWQNFKPYTGHKTMPTHKLLVFMATRWRLWTSSCSFSVTQFTLGWPSWEHRWINGERGFLKVVVMKGIFRSNALSRVIRKEPGNQKFIYKEQALWHFKSRESHGGCAKMKQQITVVTYRHYI